MEISQVKYILLAIMMIARAVEGMDTDNAYCRNCTDWYRAKYGPLAAWRYHYSTGEVANAETKDVKAGIDQATMTIVSKCRENITVATRSCECYQCSYLPLARLGPQREVTVLMDTQHATELLVMVENSVTFVCDDTNAFQQYGNYTYHISPNDTMGEHGYVCVLSSDDPPLNANIPTWVVLGLVVLSFLVWNTVVIVNRRYALYARVFVRRNRLVDNDLGLPNSRTVSTTALNSEDNSVESNPAPTQRTRLQSLDAFRGLAITLMIFVNYGGGEYWYFKHSAWNGLTVADLVFPWFIFIMGTSMHFSFQSQVRRSLLWYHILGKVLKRSVLLIIIGLILNSSPRCPHKETRLENLRIPGVLQRIGITYLVTSLVHIAFVYRQATSKLYHALEWIVHLALIAIYLCLTFLLPVPGCPTGYLGPGGLAQYEKHENCTGGAAGYIDRQVFGDAHLYQHPTSHKIYGGSVPYDPEGLLGCFTSVFLCFLGLQAGKFFIGPCWKSVRYQLLFCSVVTTCVGVLLCEGSKETGWIPINKNLWSLSFVLCLAGTSYFLLAVFYLVIDAYNLWNGAPFVYAGMNAILLYFCHENYRYYLPVSFHVPMDHWSRLLMNVWSTIFWLIVAYVLHRKKIYLSL